MSTKVLLRPGRHAPGTPDYETVPGGGAPSPPSESQTPLRSGILGDMARAAAETTPIVVEETDVEADESLAPLWRVVCHDDPVTTMDFVVTVLTRVFRQPVPRAVEVMYRVHFTGAALVGLWPEDVARSKVDRAHLMARAEGYPLTFSTEADG